MARLERVVAAVCVQGSFHRRHHPFYPSALAAALAAALDSLSRAAAGEGRRVEPVPRRRRLERGAPEPRVTAEARGERARRLEREARGAAHADVREELDGERARKGDEARFWHGVRQHGKVREFCLRSFALMLNPSDTASKPIMERLLVCFRASWPRDSSLEHQSRRGFTPTTPAGSTNLGEDHMLWLSVSSQA